MLPEASLNQPGPDAPRRGTCILLAVATVVFYAPFVTWGAPHATAPDRTKTFAIDEILPLGTLAEMHNTFVVSKPDRNLNYPWFHYCVTAAACAPYLAYAWCTGDLDQPNPAFPFGFRDPVAGLWALTVFGRLVSVLMAAGIIVCVYLFSHALWGQVAGVLAAVLTMSSYLLAYYGRTGNVDVPAYFWASVAMVAFARIHTQGWSPRRAVVIGAASALALATKETALALFVPFAALLFPSFAAADPERPRRRSLAMAAGAFAASYIVGTALWIDPARHISHIHKLMFERGGVANMVYRQLYPDSWAGVWQMLVGYGDALADIMSLPCLAAAAAGACLVARRSPIRLVILLPLVAFFVLLVVPKNFVLVRYLLPLTFIVDCLAGLALARALRAWPRSASIAALILVVGVRAVTSADLAFGQFADTRVAATHWLAGHADPGDGLEHFGTSQKLPHLDPTVRSRRVLGRTEWKGRLNDPETVLAYLRDDGPRFVVITPDWTSRPGMEHSQNCPAEVFAALLDGSVGYELAAEFRRSHLVPPVMQPRLDYPTVGPPVRIFERR